ncbi:PqqD family protein [Pararhodobacter sp. SW119]|uniref:PqqD family protein n=1 Tax=Pararhodobacter sp. SW119 TaxID=2780075 RepID=UPI001ADF5F38
MSSPWLDEDLTDLPPASAVCAVIADLAQSFYGARPEALALHCGAFLIGDRLVAMTGHAHAGKSTFMGRLTAEPDLRILCDDVLPLLADDTAMGLGIAPRLRLPLPAGASAAFRAHVAHHARLRDDRYAYVPAATVAPFGTRAPLSVLVVLDRRAQGEPRLHHLPPAQAVRHLLQQNMAPVAAEAAIARLLRLAEMLVCVRLVYADLEDAVSLVRAAFGGAALPDPSVTIHPPLPEPARPQAPAAPASAADSRWKRAPGTGMRRIGDEVFLWRPGTGQIFHLNPVAGAIWRLLDDTATPAAIAGMLSDAFAAPDPGAVLGDTCQLIGALAAADLVRPA